MTPEPDRRDEAMRAQLERARGTWALVVSECPGTRTELDRIRRALRVHRRDRELLSARLPGEVRRGARIDLEPLLDRLRAAGLQAELRRREPPEEAPPRP